MSKERELLKKAVEALTQAAFDLPSTAIEQKERAYAAVTAAKEALAQPETPYEVGRRIAKTGGGMSQLWSAVSHDGELAEAERGFKDAQLKEPEQEPVAHVSSVQSGSPLMCGLSEWERQGLVSLYTTPQQRKPLTYCQECMRPNPADGYACSHGIPRGSKK